MLRLFGGRRCHNRVRVNDRNTTLRGVCNRVRRDRQFHTLAKFRIDRLLAGLFVVVSWLVFGLILSRLRIPSLGALRLM